MFICSMISYMSTFDALERIANYFIYDLCKALFWLIVTYCKVNIAKYTILMVSFTP